MRRARHQRRRFWMRVRVATIAALMGPCTLAPMGGATAALADRVGGLGAADRLVVRGTSQIDAEQLRQPLVHDTDLVWLSRPGASRDLFIAAVARKAAWALERAGFAEARVQAAVESSDGVERLVLEVNEGPRFEAGAIEVAGLPDDMRGRLVRFLAEPQPPRDAVPRSMDAQDGTCTAWMHVDGRPATFEPPAWRLPGQASCDPPTLHRIQSEVARFLRQEGYLTVAAPVHDRRWAVKQARAAAGTGRASAHDAATSRRGPVDVTLRPAGRAIDLVVTIHDLPPKSVLRRLDIPLECRTTDRDLIAYLGLKIGQAVTDHDRIVWRERLRRSGRFVRHEVEFRGDPTDPEAVVARFNLEEYPLVTPLSQPLSRAEKTMLRFHDWLVEAVGRGDELVAEFVRPVAGPSVATAESARLILSPSSGVLLTALPDGDRACGLALSRSAVSLLPAGGGGRLEVPLPPRGWLRTTVGLSLVEARSAAKESPRFKRTLFFGCEAGAVTEGRPAGAAITLAVQPVACLSLVHEGRPEIRFDGAVMAIDADGVTSRFDSASGAPLGLVVQGCEVSLQARAGALDAAMEELRAAAGPNVFRGEAPVVSSTSFLLSGDVAAACGRVADAAGLRGESRSSWERRCGWMIDTVRRCREDGGLDRCDRLLADVAAAGVDDRGVGGGPKAAPLVIPADDEPTASSSGSAAQRVVVRHVAAVAWRFVDERCGRASWPASLVRAGACALAGDPAMLEEMADFMTSEEHGPLAHLAASSLSTVPLMAATLARRGQERLSTIAFHTDCRPLLSAAGTCGIDDCCVSLVRSLDDAAAREIGRAACGDTEMLLPLVHALRAHGRHEDAVAGLQPALDAWWDAWLRTGVAAKLDAIASPRTAVAPDSRHKEQPLTK